LELLESDSIVPSAVSTEETVTGAVVYSNNIKSPVE